MAANSAPSRSLGEFLAGRVMNANPRQNQLTSVSTGGARKSCTARVDLEAPNESSRPLPGCRSIIKQCLSLRRGVDISERQGQRPKIIGSAPAPVHVAGRVRTV